MLPCVIPFVFLAIPLCYGQNFSLNNTDININHQSINDLSTRIGNFSIELLYHLWQTEKTPNFVISPITVWNVLALITNGAAGDTLLQTNNAIRLKRRMKIFPEYKRLAQWHQVKENNVELAKVNIMLVDQIGLPLIDFINTAKTNFDTDIVSLDIGESDMVAGLLNRVIANVTNGRIKNIMNERTFIEKTLVFSSAVYFKGQWEVSFNRSSTARSTFYNDINETSIGDVFMMYNRHTYPFANIPNIQANILELPYGKENRFSMVIILPHNGLTIENLFLNFNNYSLDRMFKELKIAREKDVKVDCFLPRFRIESNIDLETVLKDRLGIKELFDAAKAKLYNIMRIPLHVSKIMHKAEIEVTEEGTTANPVSFDIWKDDFEVITFNVNRPFVYMIIEKNTNTIILSGLYQKPNIY